MSCSQLIHGLGSSIWGCCETPLIEGMTYFGHHDEFLMMSVLVCMVTHLTRPMVSHNIDY